MADTDVLVDDYLARLDRAAASLPSDRRADVTSGIREHIDAARESGLVHDETSLRDLLDRLGDPDEIVAAARDTDDPAPPADAPHPPPPGAPPTRTSPWGALEVAAVLLLALGSFLLPVLAPAAGLLCAWLSSQWTRSEKWIATGIAAIGILGPLLVLLLLVPVRSTT